MTLTQKTPSSNRQNVTAIIYDKRGRILSIGKNSYVKTHPYQAQVAKRVGEEYKIYLHAEIHAITRCMNLEKAHKMSIFRYNKEGKLLPSKPCSICASAINEVGIKYIDHT